MKVSRPKLINGMYQVEATYMHAKLIGFDLSGRYVTEPQEKVETFYGCSKREALDNAYRRLDAEVYEQQHQIKIKNLGKGLIRIL